MSTYIDTDKVKSVYVDNQNIQKIYIDNSVVYTKNPSEYDWTMTFSGTAARSSGWGGDLFDNVTKIIWEPGTEETYSGGDIEFIYSEEGTHIVKFVGKPTYIGSEAFAMIKSAYGDSEVISVSFANGLKTIGTTAFYENPNLTSAPLPSTLETIGSNAFAETDIREVICPDGLITIDEGAYNSCYNLNHLELNDGLETIGNSAFAYTGSLGSVTIPDSVTTMGMGAFRGSGLSSIVIGEGVTVVDISAFDNCNVEVVTFGSNVQNINTQAFRDAQRMHTINLNEGLLTIGKEAFQWCYSLDEITIPSTVTNVGDGTATPFTTDNLERVIFAEGFRQLNTRYAFQNCTSLKSVTFPSTMTRVANYTFTGCTGIENLTFKSTTPPTLASSTGFRTLSGVTVTVPTGCIDLYKSKSYYPPASTNNYVEAEF